MAEVEYLDYPGHTGGEAEEENGLGVSGVQAKAMFALK